MDRQLVADEYVKRFDEYVKRFPDSPLAKMKEEAGFFDNRLKDVPCPKCGRFETVKVTRAGYVKGFCRKCFNEFDLNFKEAHAEVVSMVQEQQGKKIEKMSEEATKKVEEATPEVQTRKRRQFDEELFKKLLNEGKSNIQIAAEMKTSTSVIYLHKKSLGLLDYNLKGQRVGKQIPEKFRELYAQGKTDKEIAAELGVSHSTPWSWRKRLGLAANNNPKDYNKDSRPSHENTGKEIVSALDKNIPFGYYLEIAERFVSFLEISHRASFLKFQELELAKGTSREDIDKALEIGFRMHKLGVLH